VNSKTVLVIVGATAVGKTNLAIDLARAIDGEIISADSRLFYRGMDVGTAKPTKEQLQTVPHYLIDVAEPEEIWSLTILQQKVVEAINIIHGKGKIAILVGGTGQYVRAITEGWQVPPQQPDEEFRKVIERWADCVGAEELHHKLSLVDPIAAQKIDPQNIRRTVRAIEVIFLTGRLFSEQRLKQTPDQDFWLIGLKRDRAEIYARIDARIEDMFNHGFVEETQKLLDRGIPKEHPNLSAIGYREVCEYLSGSISVEEAKTQMRKKTRVFVRRQNNWFKPDDPEIHWCDMNENPLERIINDLRIAELIK
jgi:tRNA dimethylallyltransferase